jgi:hypothetical protein
VGHAYFKIMKCASLDVDALPPLMMTPLPLGASEFALGASKIQNRLAPTAPD